MKFPNISYTVRNDSTVTGCEQPLEQRLARIFLGNEWCSDLAFYVPAEDRIIPAHQMIVASSSTALRNMICDAQGNAYRHNIISIPIHCSSRALFIVLQYLYANTFVDVKHLGLLREVLLVAEYFQLTDLYAKYIDLPEVVSVTNVCDFFEKIPHQHKELREKYLRVIDEHAEQLFANGSALQMDEQSVCELLQRDSLRVANESQLIRPMIEWATAECRRLGLVESPENRRKVLNERTAHIRFPTLSLDEFLEVVKITGEAFFTEREVSLTVQQIYLASKHGQSVAGCPFSSVRRKK